MTAREQLEQENANYIPALAAEQKTFISAS